MNRAKVFKERDRRCVTFTVYRIFSDLRLLQSLNSKVQRITEKLCLTGG